MPILRQVQVKEAGQPLLDSLSFNIKVDKDADIR
jgi:hypothetical protein